MKNQNQEKLNKAYKEGKEEGKRAGIISGPAHMIGDLFAPDSWRTDKSKARDAGFHAGVKGKK